MRSALFGFPLFLEQSGMVAPGVALVGDAAHRVHPLAGQGLIWAWPMSAALMRVLGDKEPYRRVGDNAYWTVIAVQRAEAILAMRLATDGLYRLFGTRAAPMAWARNIGMQCIERLPFIKQQLIAAASGR